MTPLYMVGWWVWRYSWRFYLRCESPSREIPIWYFQFLWYNGIIGTPPFWWSRVGGPACVRTGDVLGPTSSPFSSGNVVCSGSTLQGGWYVQHDWSWGWGIPVCLYLFCRSSVCPDALYLGCLFFFGGEYCQRASSGVPGNNFLAFYESPFLLIIFRTKGGHPDSAVLSNEVSGIWCVLPIMLCFWNAPPRLGHQWWGWWFYPCVHTLNITLIWCQPPVYPPVLVGLTFVGIPPTGVGFCGVIGVLFHPVNFTWRDNFPGQLQPCLLQCAPLVWESFQKVTEGIGGIVFPQWQCMLM